MQDSIKKPMQDKELRHWLALSQLNISGNRLNDFLQSHSSISELFSKSEQELQQLGFRQGLKAKLKKIDWDKVEQDLLWFDSDNKHLVSINNSDYPLLLKQTSGAPKLLFVYGDKALLNKHQLAIVGSRNPSPQGKSNASEFSKVLAQSGAVVTSGMALGVDGLAHKAALDAGMPTIAVAGTGLDRVYPARHKTLAEQIIEKGALVSEFALGTGVRPTNFPARNRIISGMSLGTLVVEAAVKSGSLITARTATEQGREVFAIPGSIHNPLARGCHSLIKQGAKLVETAEEIVEELGALAQWQADTLADKSIDDFVLDEDYRALLSHIDYDTTHIDQIINRSGLEISVVSHMLLLLELNNHIATAAGGYVRQK